MNDLQQARILRDSFLILLGCKSFSSVGEIWIIKWAVKRVEVDRN